MLTSNYSESKTETDIMEELFQVEADENVDSRSLQRNACCLKHS